MWVHLYTGIIAGIQQDDRSKWNDEGGVSDPTAAIVGYIAEWEMVVVPEPGVALLALLGVLTCAARRFSA